MSTSGWIRKIVTGGRHHAGALMHRLAWMWEVGTEILRRYRAVIGSTWAIRRELDVVQRLTHELAFLPAHLELADTPVHPTPHWAMRTIIGLTLAVLAIAMLGHLDIVVTARGKLIPDVRVKIIQPAISGVVRDIFVTDGQRVSAGQPLIRLDARQAAADADKARSARVDAALATAGARALLTAQQARRSPVMDPVPGASPEDLQQEQHLIEGTYQEYQDKWTSALAEVARREGELAVTRHTIDSLAATAPLARERASEKKALAAQQYVSRQDYLEAEQTALEQEHNLAAQRAHAQELRAGIDEQRANLQALGSQFRREQLEALDKATQQLTQGRDEETKAQTREQLLSLTAPVAGTVQQLAVHTLGGVVTTAQMLMEIVPDDAVEVQAQIENRDIGFLGVGQTAVVKIDAFPYARYGYLTGRVVAISNDAAPDRKLGLAFTAHIRLASNRMKVDQQWITLTPGMEASVEIRTGERRVIGYFLDPLVKGAKESLHER